MVHGVHHFDIVAPQGQRLVQVLRPRQRIADLCPAQRIGVVQRVGGILGRVQRFLFLDVVQHLGRRFAARRIQELVRESVDSALFAGFLDDVGGRNERNGAGGSGGAQARADLPGGAGRQ
ncbi:hypothetical protein D9M69_615800 [compost metagenome]